MPLPVALAARTAASIFRAARGRPRVFSCALARARPALTRSLHHGALELGEDAHHLKHRVPGRRVDIEALLMQVDVDVLGVQLAEQADEIL